MEIVMDHAFEVRLRLLEDKDALATLMNDYQRLGDEDRYADWAQCWTEDAVFEMPNGFGNLHGRREIFEVCDRQMKAFATQEHVIANMQFTVLGDEAAGAGVLVFIGVHDAARPDGNILTGGHYRWRFRRTVGGWKIAHARLIFIWQLGGDRDGTFAASGEAADVVTAST